MARFLTWLCQQFCVEPLSPKEMRDAGWTAQPGVGGIDWYPPLWR